MSESKAASAINHILTILVLVRKLGLSRSMATTDGISNILSLYKRMRKRYEYVQ